MADVCLGVQNVFDHDSLKLEWLVLDIYDRFSQCGGHRGQISGLVVFVFVKSELNIDRPEHQLSNVNLQPLIFLQQLAVKIRLTPAKAFFELNRILVVVVPLPVIIHRVFVITERILNVRNRRQNRADEIQLNF